MDIEKYRETIAEGRAALGIELGSTVIKAVLIGEDFEPLAIGTASWENRLEEGLWTYDLRDVWTGLAQAYGALAASARERYGVPITTLGALGVSAMMHGYLAFDQAGELLVPFRTWRNTNTGAAAARLTESFEANIPLRWSVAHLYQAILDGEPHVADVRALTTLAGYVHWLLSGEMVLGIGDASGMFPIDPATCDYDETRLAAFDQLVTEHQLPWRLRQLLPRVLRAGEPAGRLTPQGAALLDPSGTLQPGALLCPPEGDAGTGMVATNSVRVRNGNVSAGTSIFGMFVLEQPPATPRSEIDIVTTPTGRPVAMVHCNNCTSEINAWVALIGEAVSMFADVERGELFTRLFEAALSGEPDGGGLAIYNFLSGEPIANVASGAPLIARGPDARLTLSNFMRAQLMSALATFRRGLDILRADEIAIDAVCGHGGFFKTPQVGQRILAAAMEVPISVLETAGEGGAWGMALLAAYALEGGGLTLEDWLDERVFANRSKLTIAPDARDVEGFQAFMQRFDAALPLEAQAARLLS